MKYSFNILDPRPTPAAQTANDAIFASGPVFGIEVTVPALAARCVSNLDPQHSGGNANLAAIEAALTAELPPDGAVLATVRADLDSIGAMAILAMRAEGCDLASVMGRLAAVAASDKFARGAWSAKALPTTAQPWADGNRQLAAIGAAIGDFKVPIADRVATMRHWLLTGEEPASYRKRVEVERSDLIAALDGGDIANHLAADGRIAVVESTHRAATAVGYSLAPVVIARNPAFRFGGGEPHVKFTVCQYAGGHVNLHAALAELSELEPGWGGSPTIGGSPQGVSSQLTVDQVVAVVAKHLIG